MLLSVHRTVWRLITRGNERRRRQLKKKDVADFRKHEKKREIKNLYQYSKEHKGRARIKQEERKS